MGGAHETPDRLRSAEAPPTDLEATDLAVTVVRARDAVWVDVSDGFCELVGHSRDELIGRTPVALGMSDPKRLAWLIQRFPARGAGYAHVRVFETPHGPRLTRMHLHGVEIGGERYVIAVMHELREDAALPGGRTWAGTSARSRSWCTEPCRRPSRTSASTRRLHGSR